jgi:hypothetical protein
LRVAQLIHRCGPGWIRTNEGVRQQIYSLPQLTALVPTRLLTIDN